MTNRPNQPRTVDDLMTDDPITIKSGDSVGQARDLVLALGFNALPVTDDGEIVGIVTATDLADGWAEEAPISKVMSSPVYTIGPEATLGEAASHMLDLRVHHLVVDLGEQFGIITTFDLLRAFSATGA